MRKVINYKTSPIKEIEKLITDGYQPYGSPFVTSGDHKWQAMVKYEETLAEEPIAHAIDRPVRLTIFPSGAEELSVFLTPGREPINFIRSNHTDKWDQS